MLPVPSASKSSPFLARAPITQTSSAAILGQLPPSSLRWIHCCSYFNPHEIPLSYLDAWLHSTLPEADLAHARQTIVIALVERGLIKCDHESFSILFDIKKELPPQSDATSLNEAVKILSEFSPKQTGESQSLKEISIWASHTQEILKVIEGLQLEGKNDLLTGMQAWQQAQQSHAQASYAIAQRIGNLTPKT